MITGCCLLCDLCYSGSNPYRISCTAHFFSEDGVNWNVSEFASLNASVRQPAGTVDMYLHRPKVRRWVWLFVALRKLWSVHQQLRVLDTQVNLQPAPGVLGYDITSVFFGAMQCGNQIVQPAANGSQRYCTPTPWLSPHDFNEDVSSENFRGDMMAANNTDSAFSVVVRLRSPIV